MKLLLDKNLVGLNGEEIQNGHMGKVLANSLANSGGSEAIKYMDWALKFFNGHEVSLDDTDYKKLYDEIESNKQFTRLVKAQLLREIEKQSKQ